MKNPTTKLPLAIEFAIAFSIVIIVRGSAIFNVTWAQDDFLQLYDSSGHTYSAINTAMLRPSVAWTTDLVSWLGATHPTNGSLWSALHAGAMVIFGFALRHLWIPKSTSLTGIITALIFALFPPINNLWHYQVNHPSMTVHYALGAYALADHSKGGWRTAASVASISAALGYQIFLSLFMVALFILICQKATTHLTGNSRQSLRATLTPALKLGYCILAGTALYFITSKTNLQLSGLEQSSRTSIAELGLIPEKVFHLINDLKQLLFGRGEPSLPSNLKLVQISILATLLMALASSSLKADSSWKPKATWIIISIAALAAAAISIRIPTIFFTYTADNARVLSGKAVFWSGVFALGSTIQPITFQRIILALGILLSSSYAIVTNSICTEYVRLNQREFLIANRIVERLSRLPNSGKLRTIVVIGYSPTIFKDLRSTDVIWSGLNSSMAAGVFRETSGQDIKNPTQADYEIAKRVARDRPIWPEQQSLLILGDVGIVKFGENH